MGTPPIPQFDATLRILREEPRSLGQHAKPDPEAVSHERIFYLPTIDRDICGIRRLWIY